MAGAPVEGVIYRAFWRAVVGEDAGVLEINTPASSPTTARRILSKSVVESPPNPMANRFAYP
jgi:hypothetical protein